MLFKLLVVKFTVCPNVEAEAKIKERKREKNNLLKRR